jgi:NADPH:quinone reductase-like Zn-dependent oxidoreductase
VDAALWPEAARDFTGGRGFDVVLDSVGTWSEALRALRPGGRLVVLGASRAEHADLDIRPFYFGQYELLGTTMGSAADFAGLLRLMAEHRITPPVIDRAFALDHAADAHRHLESGAGFGKVILEI